MAAADEPRTQGYGEVMTQRVPAEQVIREMITAACPDAAPEEVRELATDVVDAGLVEQVRPADLRRTAAKIAGTVCSDAQARPVEFRVLTAALRVQVHGADKTPAAAKQRAVLMGVLLRDGQASSDQLIEDLWGNKPPQNALVTLRTYVYHVRKAFAVHDSPDLSAASRNILQTTVGGYALNMELVSSDLQRARALEKQARREQQARSYEKAHGTLDKALALFEGRPLTNEAGAFAKAQGALLDEWRLSLEEDRLELAVKLGKYAEATVLAWALTAANPLHEDFHRLLMTALYRSGHPQAAQRVFSSLRSRLVTELGVEPNSEVQRLYQQILKDGLQRGGSPSPYEHDPARRRP